MAKKNKQNKIKPTVETRGESKALVASIDSNFWKANLIPVVILFVLPFVLYWASIQFEYVLDDTMVVEENNFTKKGIAGIWDIFTTDSFQGYFGEQKKILEGGRYRPLSLVTFAIECQFFGLNPKVGHFNNILLFALSGLLLFRVLTLLIPPLSSNRWFLSLPFVASLLFVLHPIHVEVVANIKGRDEILALLLSLSALYFSLQFVKKENLFLLLATCVAFFLGMLAKENSLTWLAVIPMSLYFFTKSTWAKIGKLLAGLILTVLIYFAVRYNALGYFISSGEESVSIMNNPYFGLDAGKKAATIMYTLGMYIKLLIYPHPLTHDYYPFQIPIVTFGDWRALLALVVNFGLGIYALFGIRKKSIVSYAILFYFITLSIVSNIFVNVGTTMNDRFIYMPSVGFCIILGYFIARWLPAKLNEKPGEINVISIGLLAILVFGYATKTIMRVPDWRNALTLNTAAVKYSPNSARANCFMGVALWEDYNAETDPNRKGQLLDEVTYYINRALEIYPGYGSALTMKSGALAEQYKKDNDIDKLLAGFTQVLQYRERTQYTDEYIQYLIDQNRSLDKVLPFLYNLGYHINLKGRNAFNTALYYLNLAYQINPSDQNVIRAIAECYQKAGNQAKADEFLRKLN